MNKKQLKEVAEAALDRNPKLEKVFVTSDGQAFGNKNLADLHANTNASGKKLEITQFTPLNPADLKVNDAKDLSKKDKGGDDITPMQAAKLRAEAIAKMETVEKVEAALKDETAKSVKKAGAARIAELTKTNE